MRASRNCIRSGGAAPAALRLKIIRQAMPNAAPSGHKAGQAEREQIGPEHHQHAGKGERGRAPDRPGRPFAEHAAPRGPR